MHSFREIETAAYCPRKLYYRRKAPEGFDEVPERVRARRELAFSYEALLGEDKAIRSAPVAVTPTQFRSNLGCARARLATADWERLVDPTERDAFLSGRDCHGRAHKRLTDPPSASLVFTGEPPETGVWHPQSVRLVAVAKALAWEAETDVDRVFAEYPAYGVVRAVTVDTRRTAEYREAVRVADAIDGPPARTDNRAKCEPCEFSGECGVRTRSLRSLLGG